MLILSFIVEKDDYIKQETLFYLPSQIRFPIGRGRVTCCELKLTKSLGNSNLNFRLARDQGVLLETAPNLWASRRLANDFFAFFIMSGLVISCMKQ